MHAYIRLKVKEKILQKNCKCKTSNITQKTHLQNFLKYINLVKNDC